MIQGPDVTLMDVFLFKFPLWKRRTEAGNNPKFPKLEDLILKLWLFVLEMHMISGVTDGLRTALPLPS